MVQTVLHKAFVVVGTVVQTVLCIAILVSETGGSYCPV